jgi:hypothetical protein
MNPFIMDVRCDVCGGEGAATLYDSASQWMGDTLRHSDPRICAMNLRRKKAELDRREKELETK